MILTKLVRYMKIMTAVAVNVFFRVVDGPAVLQSDKTLTWPPIP